MKIKRNYTIHVGMEIKLKIKNNLKKIQTKKMKEDLLQKDLARREIDIMNTKKYFKILIPFSNKK